MARPSRECGSVLRTVGKAAAERALPREVDIPLDAPNRPRPLGVQGAARRDAFGARSAVRRRSTQLTLKESVRQMAPNSTRAPGNPTLHRDWWAPAIRPMSFHDESPPVELLPARADGLLTVRQVARLSVSRGIARPHEPCNVAPVRTQPRPSAFGLEVVLAPKPRFDFRSDR
jgi:hypothetical protein